MNWRNSGCSALLSRAALLLVSVVLWDCTGTETGNPTVGQVSLGLVSSDPAFVAIGDEPEEGEAELQVVGAQAGLGSLSLVGCDGSSTPILTEKRVVDLRVQTPQGDTPSGTFCGVSYDLVPAALEVPSLDPALQGQPQSVVVRLTNEEGGIASLERTESTMVELRAPDQPFVLEGTEHLAVLIDAAVLSRAHGLDQPLLDGMHIIDPTHTADATEPSPLLSSSTLTDEGGEELVSGHDTP